MRGTRSATTPRPSVGDGVPLREETGVTWDTQPATTGPVATTPSGTDKGWRSWDVTQLVGGAEHGFLIRDADENGDAEQKFNSREKGTDVPTLVLTYRAQ